STVALIFLLIAGTALAWSGKNRQDIPMTSRPGMGMYTGAMLLSADEQKQLYQAKLDFEKTAAPLRAEIRVLNMEIDQMIAAGKSGKELDAAVDKLSSLRTRLNRESVAHRLAVRNTLGEEKYLQTGRHHQFGGRGDGPNMRNERSSRSYRAKCYYDKLPRNQRDYGYRRR
ncbi:MAG: periplasmic heavy metal sensor, partial [Candidatus Neomarinimicrobiota bacterium]